jgi:hypothetical protein
MSTFIATLISELGDGPVDSAPVWEKIYEFIMQQITETSAESRSPSRARSVRTP